MNLDSITCRVSAICCCVQCLEHSCEARAGRYNSVSKAWKASTAEPTTTPVEISLSIPFSVTPFPAARANQQTRPWRVAESLSASFREFLAEELVSCTDRYIHHFCNKVHLLTEYRGVDMEVGKLKANFVLPDCTAANRVEVSVCFLSASEVYAGWKQTSCHLELPEC